MIRTSHLDGTMSALEEGSGPVAMFVHGFPFDARMWRDQIDALAAPDRRVVAIDLRGHGRSPWRGDAAHTMDLLADDLIAVIESLDVGSVDLVGLSMGGYVVLSVAERRPDLLRSLALVDTRAGADSDEGRAGRDATAASVLEHGRGRLVETLMPKLLAEGARSIVRARVRTMVEELSYESILADLAGMRDRPDRSTVLGSIGVPVGVIVGEHDVLTPPSEAEAMCGAIAGSTLTLIPSAAHLSPMEAPEAVNQALTGLWIAAG